MCTLLIVFGAGIANTIIHGIFAFNNPDQNAGTPDCWAILGNEKPMTLEEV